jgi:hypothetical protein
MKRNIFSRVHISAYIFLQDSVQFITALFDLSAILICFCKDKNKNKQQCHL